MAYHHHHHHHHLSYLNSPSQFTNSTSLKIKIFIKSYVIQHVRHAVRATKSMFMELFHQKSTYIIKIHKFCKHRRRSKSHVHHSSSHIIPIPEPPCNSEEFFDVSQCLYYDATWNSMISSEDMDGDPIEPPPVEEKNRGRNEKDNDNEGGNEIDRLAEKFIASCHEKFRLEKQESYRRYLEMLARSV
ncbi:uncharacterized protein LOC122003959 [Zingiber officinale]|uniref:uncharacterized protein LOC122003959 n=1 Tax=Zingiber officinale TaxID=94328 RepID=UPI001C4CB589|nr:uncharacterized protein LOC122003959 [Zingiber officinale]